MLPESAPTPTILPPRLKLWARATRWLLALVVSFALLLALFWGLLNWLIVPRIDEFRPALERLTRQATGLQIQIGQLQARSGGLIPSFALRDVRLLDAQGQAALQLPEVLVAISPRSLLKRGLEQLVIEGAQLEIKRTADGRFWVAGIDIGSFAPSDPQPLLNWLFSQTEWALLNGSVLWRDEQQGLQTELQQVNWVMRNSGQRHHMRFDATPQTQWGDRISVRGMLRQPLLSGAAGNWRQWSGELYAELGRIEAAPLQAYARLAGLDIAQGRGALRTWIDVERGRVVGALADVQLSQVQAQLGSKLPALALNSVSGRLGWQQLERSTQVRAEALSFESADGVRWPAGNVQWTGQQAPAGGAATRSQLSAERIDLQALTALAQRVSMPAQLHEQLLSLRPQGLLETLQMSWVGALSQPEQLQAQGRVRQLALSAQAAERGPGRPGLQGADVDFQWKRDAKQLSGQASINLQGGHLEFPGVFSEPRIALEGLKTKIKFTHSASASSVEFEPSQLQTQDAQGQFQGSWSRQGGEGLGQLDLQGQLSRADANRVHRYLPLAIPEPVRRYVQTAVSQGQLSDVAFKVKGPLARFPFAQAGEGEFFVNAKLRNARYDYVPSYLAPKAKPWPAFEQLDADLSFNRASLQISNARAQIAGRPGLVMQKTLARIADLGSQSNIEVSGEIRGPVNQGLQLVQSSPLAGMTREVLSQASASGSAELQLRLNLPLRDLDSSTVQGSLLLAGNDLELGPDVPLLAQTAGTVQFTQSSVQVLDAQARVLGGDLRFEGTIEPKAGAEPEALFKGQGQLSAEGLKQLRGQPWLSELTRHISGSTSYSATLGLRQGWLEASVQSPLKGMALNLPEPLAKPADAQWPLRIERTMVLASLGPDRKAQDRITLQIAPAPGLAGGLSASYLRDVSGPTPQVLAGDIALGSAPRELLGGQVRAQIQWPQLDLDAWDEAGSGLWEGNRGQAQGYLPTAIVLRSPQLRIQGHTLQQVALNASREGALWRGNIEASEVSGQAEYRPPGAGSAGRLYARLSRLSLGQVTSNSVENLLDKQPASMPALDIVVDELDLRGRKLGRLEIEALNRIAGQGAREWRLAKLILSVPEARLSATGSWAAPPTGTAPGRPGEAAQRRNTQMTFRLDINDSGELLKRLGMDGAIRRGKGKLEGQIGWSGSPLSLHTPSMTGQFTVDVESGQFLKAEPGVAKLLGVLNLQALPRRLTLDFRDVFSEGFSFDWVRGEVSIDQGVARTDSLRMKGVNAAVLLAGLADIGRETQDLRVVVVPEINAGTASLLASAINPAVGLGTFIAQWLLRRPINEANTQEFLVRGTWADPVIERVGRKPAAAAPQTP